MADRVLLHERWPQHLLTALHVYLLGEHVRKPSLAVLAQHLVRMHDNVSIVVVVVVFVVFDVVGGSPRITPRPRRVVSGNRLVVTALRDGLLALGGGRAWKALVLLTRGVRSVIAVVKFRFLVSGQVEYRLHGLHRRRQDRQARGVRGFGRGQRLQRRA